MADATQQQRIVLPVGTQAAVEGETATLSEVLFAVDSSGEIVGYSTDAGVTWVWPTPITDHGGLTGLADDDHTHYLTTARHLATNHSETGHWEVLMAEGAADPPDPLETGDGLDWLYVWVTD